MSDISTAIQQLVNYGLDTGLILPDDEIYIRNQLLMTMQLDSFTEPEGDVCYADLESILKTLVDDAAARGVCDDSPTARDLFDTRLMGVLTPRPSIVRANFEERYETDGPQAATDWFYKFSQDTDYIRRYRIKRDVKWVTRTPYGDLDITINLSKPEKDPKAIAAAKLAPQSAYPKCQLCVENEGYAGRLNHPARENHRIIPLTINDSAWNFQYSPYVYYNEHCIVFNNQHTPMKIERATFRKLLDFVSLFPHYFVGSNADLPIVGGSILSHDHFQGGHYEFAMAKAPIEKKWVFPGFEDVDAGIVHWPMSCIRLTCADDARALEAALCAQDGVAETMRASLKTKLLADTSYSFDAACHELGAAADRLEGVDAVAQAGFSPEDALDLSPYYFGGPSPDAHTMQLPEDEGFADVCGGVCAGMVGANLVFWQDGTNFIAPIKDWESHEIEFLDDEIACEYASEPQQISLF